MAKTRRPNKRPGSLSHGRPPTVNRPAASLSSKATRSLIRSHHQLQKARVRALADGNEELVRDIEAQLSAKGGLESYQLASKRGQSKDRGGDSSKILIKWLAPLFEQQQQQPQEQHVFRLLEVGALSTKNACSMVKVLEVSRIDLNSQGPGILQQDFMDRPLPASDADRFHIISLSLVLNYVPEPATRGRMLLRTTQFLTATTPIMPTEEAAAVVGGLLPCLFLVLPAACVLNSRYFTEDRLQEIMSVIGYVRLKCKVTNKLIYYLWQYQGTTTSKVSKKFRKELLNDGRTRNNFTITLH